MACHGLNLAEQDHLLGVGRTHEFPGRESYGNISGEELSRELLVSFLVRVRVFLFRFHWKRTQPKSTTMPCLSGFKWLRILLSPWQQTR